jgi:glucokinase
VKVNGLPCTCGRRGCLEAYASGTASLREYRYRIGQPDATTQMFDAAIRANSPEALYTLDTTCDWLGVGLSIALGLLNPDVVTITGGVAQLGAPFFDSVIRSVQRYAHPLVRDTRIVPAQLSNAGIIGAAALARRAIKS